MKKYLALVLALVMCLALVACGGNAEPETDPAAPAADVEPAADPAAPADEAEPAATDWSAMADVFTLTFEGATAAGETVAFALTEDETYAVLAVADTETMESVSFVGPMTEATFEDGTTGYTITDETTGNTISFSAEFDLDNASVTMNLGEEYGEMVVTAADQAEVFDLFSAIEIATVAIA